MKIPVANRLIIALGLLFPLALLGAPKDATPDSLTHAKALDHYLTGSIQEEAGDLYRALAEYQVAYMLDSTSVTIATALSEAWFKLGYADASVKILEASSRTNPGNSDLLHRLIVLYMRANNGEAALNCYHQLAGVNDLSREDLARYAALSAALEKPKETLKLFKQYLERFGGDPDIYEKMGIFQIGQRDIAAAETCFVRLVAMDSTAYRVMFVLGGFAVSREDWPTAENYFRRALSGDSTNLRVWTNLLLTLNEQGKYDEALATVGLAEARFADVPQLIDIEGSTLERLKRYNEALVSLARSVALDSTRATPLLTIGFIHHQLGEWEQAADAYDRALALDAGDAMVLNNYAYLLSEWNQRLDDALQFVNEALKLRPETSSFIDTRGWIYYRMGRFKDAEKDIKKAMKDDSSNPELHYHLGEIYRSLGKTGKAQDEFRRAHQLDPDNEHYRTLAE